MKRTLAMMLAMIMVLSTVVVGISAITPVTASAEDAANPLNTGSDILNADGNKPVGDDSVLWGDIYGMDNSPFLLSEQNELFMITTSADTTTSHVFNGIESEAYKENSDGAFTKTPNVKNYTNTVMKGDNNSSLPKSDYKYRYLNGVAFDPLGSGRKEYAAYIGAIKTGDGKFNIHCIIINAKTGVMKTLNLGSANWISSVEDEVNVLSNYMAITAGDYDNDHKDSVIVYHCGDSSKATDKNFKLYEVKFDGTNLSKSEVFDLSTVIKNDDIYGQSDIKYKPIVSLTTGDFDGDQVEEYAYSVGFHNTSGSAKNGWGSGGKEVTSSDYFATAVGVGDYSKGWKHATPARLAEKDKRDSLNGTTEVYSYKLIQGGAISGGDLDGDGIDEIVLVGYKSNSVKGVFENGTMTKMTNVGDLDNGKYFSSVIYCNGDSCSASEIYEISCNNFNKASMAKWEDTYNVYPQIAVECVATNGTNRAEDVFIAGTFYSFKGDSPSFLYSVFLATQTFDTVMDGSTQTSCYYFGSTAVGNFDHNNVGREQIFYAVWFKHNGSKNYNAHIGIAGGSTYSDTYITKENGEKEIQSYGSCTKYACCDTRADCKNYTSDSSTSGSRIFKDTTGHYCNVAPVAVDIDDDGLLVKHNTTTYAYTDPEVVAVLQAAPIFGKIDELGGYNGDSGTSYTLESTSGYSTTRGDTVSFGVGFTGELEAGVWKGALELGYSLDWEHTIEKAYSQTTSTTWSGADVDIVCLIRTPVMRYLYDVWSPKQNKWVEAGHKVEAPLAPVKYSLSIPDYNSFVDEYNTKLKTTALNKITSADLPEGTEGNPYAYYSSASQAGQGAAIISDNYAISYTGGAMTAALTKEAEISESTTFTHGFSFSFSSMWGGGGTYGGFYLNLDYGDIFGKSETSGNAQGIEGSVPNISEKSLLSFLTAQEIRQYYFSWNLGRWARELAPGSNMTVPFYGYFVQNIKSPIDPPTNLTAEFTSTDANTSVKLEWDASESIPGGPQIKGYYIFDNGEPVNSNIYLNTDTGRISYIHNGISYGSKHNYTVKAVSQLDGVLSTSVPSEEVSIGWVTTGNIIEKIYKDEEYTSSDGLVDRYVIRMSDDSEFAFYVSNGKDGADGTNGIDGKTAYEIAVANGYTGTQQEWLNQIGAACGDSHTYKTYSIPATCNSDGITIKVCEVCGWAESSTTEKGTHSYKAYKTVDATCISKGYTIYKCEKCNDFYYDNETDCIAHTTATKTVSGTCNTQGTTVEYCTVCGYIANYDISEASGHSYEVKETVAPTCLSKGYTVSECSACGDKIITDIKPIAAHDYTDETIEATCTGAGFTSHKCKNCDSMYITGYTPATGHNYTKEVTAPTCSQKGYTTYTCQTCGENHIADVTASSTEHTFKDKVIKNTCISDGYTIHYCEVCGYQQIIDEKDASGHNYEVSQVIPSTCTTKGYSISICKDCGASYKGNETDFSDHVSSGWICDDAAAGHHIKKCEKCGEMLEEKTVVIGVANGGSAATPIKNGDVVSLNYGEELSVAPTTTEGSNIIYTSSDPSIATVDENGVVTAKNSGTVTIIVTDTESGVTTSFDVDVKMTWWQRVHKVLSGFVFVRALFELLGVKY